MTLEQLVTDLATSQRLKDAGFPQDTAMVWVPAEEFDEYGVGENREPVLMERTETLDEDDEPMYEFCAAPTAEEILKELPPYLQGSCVQLDLDVMHFSGCNFDGTPALLKWIVQWCCPEIDEVEGAQESESTLVFAAAQAYLWWKREVAG